MKQLIANPSVTVGLLKKYGIKPSKRFGQNFIIDPNSLKKIIKNAGISRDDVIVEVGPGLGSLTELISLEGCKKVYAVELDRALHPVLKDSLSGYENIELVAADAMVLDLAKLKPRPNKLISNLPYNIASPLLIKYLHDFDFVEFYLIMLQKEVAQRLLSNPGSREYGGFTVKLSLMADVSDVMDVSGNVFIPKPKVGSSVIKLVRKKDVLNPARRQEFFGMVNAAFAQKRKKMINSIADRMDISKEELAGMLDDIGIDINVRAENLSLNDYLALFERIKRR